VWMRSSLSPTVLPGLNVCISSSKEISTAAYYHPNGIVRIVNTLTGPWRPTFLAIRTIL
jgi:hypothetical protein